MIDVSRTYLAAKKYPYIRLSLYNILYILFIFQVLSLPHCVVQFIIFILINNAYFEVITT